MKNLSFRLFISTFIAFSLSFLYADDELKKLKSQKDKLAAQSLLRVERNKQKNAGVLEEIEALKLKYQLMQQRLQNELVEIEVQRKKMNATKGLEDTKFKSKNGEIEKKKQRLYLQNALQAEELKLKTASMRAEKELLMLQNALETERFKRKTASMNEERQLIQARMQLENTKRSQALKSLRAEREKLSAENSRMQEQLNRQDLQFKKEQSKIQMEIARMNYEAQKLKHAQGEHLAVLAKLQTDISIRQQKEAWRNEVNKDLQYPKIPYEKDVLKVSDRRIALNGPIIKGTGNYVTERIHYYNNKSEKAPIFIVIDRCPGGSAMEGYRILKAMEASKAPVHVVVKSFAASMAAIILTMADHSYAYKNAVILHHQPWTVTWGNITEQSEQMKIFKEWAKRLHEPVAHKMGVSLEEFYKVMYEKNSRGDWQEFADKAKEYKWLNHLVAEIREEGVNKKPAGGSPRPWSIMMFEKRDDYVLSHVQLPKPEPFDYYFIYNPEGYYRWK